MYRVPLVTINNKTDPNELEVGECVTASNVDFRNTGSIRRRKGFSSLASLSGVHSLWADNDAAFVVASSVLYQISSVSPWLLKTVGSLSSNTPVKICRVNDGFALTNLGGTRFISNGVFLNPTLPTDSSDDLYDAEIVYKSLISSVAGTDIAFYNGRLYIANGETIVYSDPYDVTIYDIRDYVIPFSAQVKRILPVDDGMWVATFDKLVFLSGASPETFTYRETPLPKLVMGTEVKTLFTDWKDSSVSGKAYACVIGNAICLLGNGGAFKLIAENTYAVPTGDTAYGAGHIRIKDGQIHYLSTIYSADGTYNEYNPQQITVDSFTY